MTVNQGHISEVKVTAHAWSKIVSSWTFYCFCGSNHICRVMKYVQLHIFFRVTLFLQLGRFGCSVQCCCWADIRIHDSTIGDGVMYSYFLPTEYWRGYNNALLKFMYWLVSECVTFSLFLSYHFHTLHLYVLMIRKKNSVDVVSKVKVNPVTISETL